MIPKGTPKPKSESCWILRTRLARAASNGKGSPGTELAEPSRVSGDDRGWSQNAESIAVRKLGILLCRVATSQQQSVVCFSFEFLFPYLRCFRVFKIEMSFCFCLGSTLWFLGQVTRRWGGLFLERKSHFNP